MEKLKLGIWIDNMNLNNNGADNYFDSTFHILKKNKFRNIELYLFSNSKKNIETNYFNLNLAIQINKIYKIFSKHGKNNYLFAYLSNLFFKLYKLNLKNLENKIDLMCYLTPTDNIIPDFPFIFNLWDLGHLSTYSFPELSMYNSLEFREKFYKDSLKKALLIFSESNSGKTQLINYLNIFPDKIFILPMISSRIASNEIKAVKPLNFSFDNYIHYPAHFWPHKNHYNLILAFKNVLNYHKNIKLILFGEDKGTKIYILNLIKELNLELNIFIFNRFDIEELKWIYLNSIGLVYPSFLGPTNMPIMEAYELNCNIACSNLDGHIEQVNDFAVYFDPKDHKDISHKIITLIEMNKRIPNKKTNQNSEDAYLLHFENALNQILPIRKTWKN